ncbi:MAG: hypothetical protein ABEJ70_02500 [Halobacteriaceae archaeon]
MPTIDLSADQRAYLDDLRDRLAAEHVGAYGHVRPRDAVQYLIDSHEGDVGEGVATDATVDDGAEDADDAETGDAAEDADDADESATMDAMMALLETHDDKWDSSEDEDARYVVHLPDGDEHVRTKGEVKALLFKNFR